MEKLGGTVGVESQLGAGALFWFELPVAVAVNPTAATD
jgi:signal transduction histidine kinase